MPRVFILCSITVFGCEPVPSNSRHPTNERIQQTKPNRTNSSLLKHSFGTILAHDNELSHNFSIRNVSKRAIHVQKAVAMTPCCSSINVTPLTIQPGEHAEVGVVIKPGHQSGAKKLDFFVETDDESRPLTNMEVSVNLIAGWEFNLINRSPAKCEPGMPIRCTYEIICRASVPDTALLPDSASVSKEWVVIFGHPSNEIHSNDEFTEVKREVSFFIPPSEVIGFQKQSILFRWPDNTTREEAVGWIVQPPLTANPSSLTVPASSSPQTVKVQITSESKRFTGLILEGKIVESYKAHLVAGERRTTMELTVILSPLQYYKDKTNIYVLNIKPLSDSSFTLRLPLVVSPES